MSCVAVTLSKMHQANLHLLDSLPLILSNQSTDELRARKDGSQ